MRRKKINIRLSLIQLRLYRVFGSKGNGIPDQTEEDTNIEPGNIEAVVNVQEIVLPVANLQNDGTILTMLTKMKKGNKINAKYNCYLKEKGWGLSLIHISEPTRPY